ncbi:unnamed protein product, partial [Trichobilharzia regenti]
SNHSHILSINSISSTQFESTYARRVFPCWDEPGFKAVFQVRVLLQFLFTKYEARIWVVFYGILAAIYGQGHTQRYLFDSWIDQCGVKIIYSWKFQVLVCRDLIDWL